MQKQPIRLILMAAILLLFMGGMMVQLFSIMHKTKVTEVSVKQGQYHLHIPLSAGMIYDSDFVPLNQSEEEILAVVNPTPQAMASIFTKLRDRDAVNAQLQERSPFVCELNEDARSTADLYILHGRRKKKGILPAQHLLGYRQNGVPTAGLELAFADWLTACDTFADVTFTVSGVGEVLAGAEQSMICSGQSGGGIVTTLNADIQQIAENALQQISPAAGAAVVMECSTGNIAACASTPVYDPDALAGSLDRDDAPFLNRALSAYSVGSVFKLVTASAALESGIPVKHMYKCTGEISVYGQRFRCHQRSGHGLMDMQQAMLNSCNPYFISLSTFLTPEAMHDTAAALGFGTETILANGLVSASGYLPDTKELQVEAEKANMSFGQGKLLATPLQVTAMTACIANKGIYSKPKLFRGLTADGKTLLADQPAEQYRALSEKTAAYVRRMMVTAIEKSETTKAKPENTRAGGKTSTAQTGSFDADGNELNHAWITGFFPVNNPKYAVTVFVEYGGYGNQAAAPVFRRIIEQITDKQL